MKPSRPPDEAGIADVCGLKWGAYSAPGAHTARLGRTQRALLVRATPAQGPISYGQGPHSHGVGRAANTPKQPQQPRCSQSLATVGRSGSGPYHGFPIASAICSKRSEPKNSIGSPTSTPSGVSLVTSCGRQAQVKARQSHRANAAHSHVRELIRRWRVPRWASRRPPPRRQKRCCS